VGVCMIERKDVPSFDLGNMWMGKSRFGME